MITGDADNFPEGAFCQTQTAHGHFDADGTFWNIMACIVKPAPTVAYFPYKIPNAQRFGPHQFDNPPSQEEFLASIIFGEPFFNTDKEDGSIHYHHMTSITQKYCVIPFNSLKIDLTSTVTNTLINGQPLTSVSFCYKNLN